MRIDAEDIKLFIRDVAVNCAVLIVIYLIVVTYIAAPFKVIGDSMKETLFDREYIMVSKLGYYGGGPGRGDIVVFHPPTDNHDDYYIKRVIGVPGDRVELKGGDVFVNGQELDEDYLRPGLATCLIGRRQSSCPNDEKKYIVPEGEYFVLGDNRDGSSDSRAWRSDNGEEAPFVKMNQIQGKTKFVFWPLPEVRWVMDPRGL
jgi:signal peptidase I